MQAMNSNMISPEQEQSYSVDMPLLAVSMQFESASNRNVVMLQNRYRDIKGKLPVQVKECSKHHPDKDELKPCDICNPIGTAKILAEPIIFHSESPGVSLVFVFSRPVPNYCAREGRPARLGG